VVLGIAHLDVKVIGSVSLLREFKDRSLFSLGQASGCKVDILKSVVVKRVKGEARSILLKVEIYESRRSSVHWLLIIKGREGLFQVKGNVFRALGVPYRSLSLGHLDQSTSHEGETSRVAY